MSQSVKVRLDKLEQSTMAGERFIIVKEWPDGSLTHEGQPWQEEQARQQDLVIKVRSFEQGEE
jgi:hypothetical protein